MRKLLLASAATLGTTLVMTGGAMAQAVKPVAAGTLVVHFNGYLQFELGDEGSTFNTVTNATGTFKLNPVTTIGDFRIYPGFDAKTVDGIEYGVATDIRTGYSNAGVGENGKPTSTSTSVSTSTSKTTVNKATLAATTLTTTTTTTTTASSSLSSLYVKRAYGYLGTAEYGYVRFGQTDSAFTLLQSGVVEAFGDGGQWTLEGGQALMFPSNSVPAGGNQFIYADTGNVYSTDKVVYISPAYAGVNAVVGYEPNSNGLKEGYLTDTGASSTSANLSSSPVPGDIGTRRKNTVDAGVQYLNTLDGFKIKASGDILHGAPIAYTGPAATLTAAPYGGYDSLNVYQLGGQVTFAGLTLGANLKGGQVEDGYGFKPKGGRDAVAYTIGASYVIGPYVVGASYFNSQSNGAYVPGGKVIARTLNENGLAVGANYVISPDISLFTQYEYGQRHQPGNAFGVTRVGATGNYKGDSHGLGVSLGATVKW